MIFKRRNSGKSDLALITIGVFKLVKCMLFTLAGLGALRLVNTDVAKVFNEWAQVMHFDISNHYIHRLISYVSPMNEKQLRLLGFGSFVYAALFLIEGTGLVLQKLWAEYFTTIITSTFIPFECYALLRHFTLFKLLFLAVNIVIVGYLILRIRHERKLYDVGEPLGT